MCVIRYSVRLRINGNLQFVSRSSAAVTTCCITLLPTEPRQATFTSAGKQANPYAGIWFFIPEADWELRNRGLCRVVEALSKGSDIKCFNQVKLAI